MLSLQGAPALSPFRVAKLLASLRVREPAVTGLTSRFVHFIDSGRALERAESAVLEQLLTYGPRPGNDSSAASGGASGGSSAGAASSDAGALVIVVPRAGTISSWSSKATDIAQVCGLS